MEHIIYVLESITCRDLNCQDLINQLILSAETKTKTPQDVFCAVSVKRRLQTGCKMQTEGEMQTADCRPGVKCRLRIK